QQGPFMNRILEIPPEQLTAEQSKIFEQLTAGRGRILGPYKVWIHSPTVASGMEHIGTYLNKRSSLSPREVETGWSTSAPISTSARRCRRARSRSASW